MASTSPRKRLRVEATCPSCLEYFIDPMILDCGHNLCFRCVAHIWRDPKVTARCPQCTAVMHPGNFKPNLQLANMVEIARALSSPAKPEGEGGEYCEKHREPLKLFCKDDKTPICLVCDRSKQHRDHQVIPVDEAGQEYEIWKCLETLREEKDKLLAYKTLAEKESQDLLKQTKAERTKTTLEFQDLHQFLEDQEKHLLAQMEELEEEITKKRDENMVRLSEELSSLETLIRELEEKQQQPAGELLQDIGSALERCQKGKLENPVAFPPELKWSIWDLCDITPYLKNVMEQFKDHLLYGFRLRKGKCQGLVAQIYRRDGILLLTYQAIEAYRITEGKRQRSLIIAPSVLPYGVQQLFFCSGPMGAHVNINLDPLTASPWLILSADCKSLSEGERYQSLPDNPERFDTCSFVLGREGFTTGRHFWEVCVGSEEQWAIGVAKESVKRKGNIVCGPAEGIWEMGAWGGEYRTFNPPANPILSLREKPSKIYVTLNYEGQRVAFYDADRANLLCTFTEATFDGEVLRPWFYVSKKAHLTLSS